MICYRKIIFQINELYIHQTFNFNNNFINNNLNIFKNLTDPKLLTVNAY